MLTARDLQALTDNELAALEDVINTEKQRRWARLRPSFVEDLRASLPHPRMCSCGYALGHPGPCQALFF